ncbi:MAG: ATP-binding protein [Arcticibacter sp.]
MDDLRNILAKTDLFSGLSQEDLDTVAKAFSEKKVEKDQEILVKGESGQTLFIIESGSTKVHDGEAQIAQLNAGDFFGEMAFFDNSPRSMSVTSISPCTLYKLEKSDFQTLFQQRPHVLQHMVSAITNRIRRQNDRIISDLKNREAELKSLVDKRTADLAQRNDELSKALTELKNAQDQLIQQEKLASLGQLTAGIAHEIKNPLNFVTNFAKLSFELIDELITSENPKEREESGDFLRQNLNKIYEHGSRADNIVKGMLEHTRANSEGKRQPEDINQICEQFLKIAQESFVLSNPGFEVEVYSQLDKSLPMIEAASLDISKVFLNLFTNAFYSMNEKKESNQGYHPILKVESKLADEKLVFTVSDNGLGIQQENISKVFNPFFTTKPTGKGTGLGLSITHDIMKSHGGYIRCTSSQGNGAEFTLEFPVS